MRGNNLLIDVNIPQARDIKTRINEEPMEVLIHKHAGLDGPFRLRGFAEMVLRCERDSPPTSLLEREVQRGITRPRGIRFPLPRVCNDTRYKVFANKALPSLHAEADGKPSR
jgi:hypothetical protein